MKIKPARGKFSFSLGDRGEIIAADYFLKQGYKIIDKKIRAPFGELDLVAEKEKNLIFVEVKTRSTKQLGAPEEAVDEAKQRQITKLADWYLQKTGYHGKTRFDVLAILYNGSGEPQIRHIQNAFEAQRAGDSCSS